MPLRVRKRRDLLAIPLDPGEQTVDAFVRRDAGLPAELARGAVDVAVEDRLVAEPRRGVAHGDRPLQARLEHAQQLFERKTEGRSAAHVVGTPGHGGALLGRGEIQGDEVVDPQEVAHLEPVPVEGDRQAEDRGEREPRDPSLVLLAELAGPVDARLPHRHGRQAEAAVVVDDVLVGRALRAAVGRFEGERLRLRHSGREFCKSQRPSRTVSPMLRWP